MKCFHINSGGWVWSSVYGSLIHTFSEEMALLGAMGGGMEREQSRWGLIVASPQVKQVRKEMPGCLVKQQGYPSGECCNKMGHLKSVQLESVAFAMWARLNGGWQLGQWQRTREPYRNVRSSKNILVLGSKRLWSSAGGLEHWEKWFHE